MWKKILCTFFLLFGLLSLFSCGYAITLNDIQNEVDNFVGFSDNRFTTFVHSSRFENVWNYVSSHTDTSLYNRYMLWCTNSEGLTGSITLFNDSGITGYYNWRQDNNTSKGYQLFCVPNMTYRCNFNVQYNKQTSGTFNGFYMNLFEASTDKYTIKNFNDSTFFCNIDKPIYTSYNEQVINDNSDIYTYYNYPQSFFNWSTNSNLSTIQVNGFGTSVPYLQWSSSSILLGTINQYSNLNLGRSWFDRYIYRNGNWEFLDQRQISHWGRVDNSNDIGSIYLESNVNNISGAIYVLHLEANDTSQFNEWNIPFYNASSNDIIQNGTLILNDTFSGDFNNNYQNQINTQQTQDKIDNVSDTLTDDSEVDNIMSDLLGDSGDAFLSNLDYNPLENPFVSICRSVVQGVNDVLLGSGYQILDFTFNGHTYYFDSRDFTLPNGDLKTFVYLVSNCFLFWALIKYGFKLYEWVRSGRIKNWMRETMDKDIEDYFLF